MPNLEDILNGQKTNLNLVVKPRVSTITQEELDAYRDGIDAALESGLVNKEGFTMLGEFSESTKDAALNNNDYLSKLFTTPNRVEQFNTALNQVVEPEPELDSKKDVVLDTDKSDILARYDFPLYADTEDLAEQQAFNDQTNMQAIWKGAKNIVPVAIGLGAEMLGGAVQGINNQLGDDDYSNWMMDWGNNFMKKYVSPVYQNPDGKTFDSPKSAIAAGADIFGQFGSAVGSMVAMTPINKGIVGASTAIGATIGGVPGAALGSLIGVISAAALNAYSEGVIEAADVFDTKKAELLKDTNNYAYSHETAKLAAGTTATQNMLLNTALNIIPVMWSVKPYGVDRAIKNSLNLHDTNLTWFRLQKPYVPTQLAGESADDLISRLAKIKANDFANNAKYSMISNPWEALKNIRGYGSQKLSGFKYNVRNPAEFLRRNWDVVGETFGEGLEEYHNYFARQQGLAVYNKDDASMIPSIPKLMQGYSDLITKGEGTHDFVAGTIIGGMSAPIFSSVRFGRSKVYNPDTGEMEFKYQRHKMFDFIPWELNRDFEQKDYESTITNSLMMLQDAKELSHAYINSTDESEKEALLNRMLVAPITHYVDTNMLETYKLSLDVFKDNISNGILHKDESVLKGYMSDVSRKQFEEASNERLAELSNGSPDMAKLNQYNVRIEQLLENAAKEGNKHIHKIQNKIDFVKKTADEYKKVKSSIETTYGGIDYGYANALFKNKTAMDMEEDIFKRVSNNRNSAYLNLKNVVSNANPNLTPEQLSLKIDEELQDNNSGFRAEKDAYIETQKRYYESLLRKTKFSQRYNSLNSWGYENDSDLMEEMTLMEQLNMVSFTPQELTELGMNDNMDEVNYLTSVLESLKSITEPTQEDIMKMGMIEMFLNKSNSGVLKLIELKKLIERIKEVQAKQVSNQENFKGDDKTFKDFNPLLKFIKRNKLFTAEAKKLSKAKKDIELIQLALESYKKYADVYADYLTEKDKQTVFETGVEELQKMLYLSLLNVSDTSIKNKLESWLKEHDDKFGQVIGELIQIKLDNKDNESINTYINRMIEMMQYQKDVVDQLKTLNTVKDIKLGSTYENIIQSLNNGSMSVENAINNINQIIPNNDLRKAILDAINDLQSGVNTATHYGFKSQYSYDNNSSINYYTNGTDIFIENGKLEKFSHKDGKIIYEIDTSFLNITTNNEEYNLTLEEVNGDNIANLLKLKPIEFYINDFMIKLMNKYSDVIKAENIFTKSLLNQITTFTDKSQFALEHKLTNLYNIFENLVNDDEKVSSDIFDELGRVLFMFNNKEIFGDYEINGILLDLIDDNTSLIDIILEGEKVHVGKTDNSWVSIEPNSKVYVNKNVQDLNLFRINGDIITIIPNVGFTPAQVILINTALDNNDFSNINFSYEKVDIDLSKNIIDKSTYVYNEKGKLVGDSAEPTENIVDKLFPTVGLQIYLKLDTFKEEQTDKEKLIFDLKQKIQTVDTTKSFDEFTYSDMKENVDKMNFIEYQLLQEDYHNPNLFLFYISKNYNKAKRSDNYVTIHKLLKDKYLKKEEEDFIKIFDVNTALIHKIGIQNKVQVKTGWEKGNNFYIIDGSLYYKPEGTKLYLIGINGFVSTVESNKTVREPLNNKAKQLLVLDDKEKKSLISVINHSVNKIGDTSLIYPQGITIDFGDISKPIDTESYIYTLTMYGNNITIDGEDIKIEKKGTKEPTIPVPYTYDEETFNSWWTFVNNYVNVTEENRLKKVIKDALKPTNQSELEAKKADIERRRQEELDRETPVKNENIIVNDGTDNLTFKIITFKDGSTLVRHIKTNETTADNKSKKLITYPTLEDFQNLLKYDFDENAKIIKTELVKDDYTDKQSQEVKATKEKTINAKYDAELKALEQPNSELEAKKADIERRRQYTNSNDNTYDATYYIPGFFETDDPIYYMHDFTWNDNNEKQVVLKKIDDMYNKELEKLEELLKNSTTISPEIQQKINTIATLINSTPIPHKGVTIDTTKLYEVIDNKLYIFSEGKHEDAVKVDLSELFKYKYQDNVETLFTQLTERALYIDLEELFSNENYIFWVIKMIGIKKQQVNSRGAFTYFLNDYISSYIIQGYSNNDHKQQIELYNKYIDGILNSNQPIHLWRKVKETDVDYIDDSTFMYSSNADKFSGRNQLVRTKRKGDGVIYIKVQDETNPKVLTKELYKDDLLNMMINGEGFIYTDDIFEKTVQKNNEDKIHLPFKSFGNKFYFNGGEYFIYKMKTGNNLVFLKNDKGYYLRNEDIVRDVDGMIMFSPEFKFAFPIKNKKTRKPFEFYPIEGNYLPFTSAIINEFKTYLTDNKEFNLYSFIHYLDGDNKLGVNDYIQNFSRKFFKRAVDSKINESEIPEKVLNNTFISFIRLLREVSKDVNFKSFFRITDDIVVYKGEVFNNRVIVPNENLDNFILTNLINFPFNSTNVQGFIDKFNLVNIKREDINPDDLSEGNNNDIYGNDPVDYTEVVEKQDEFDVRKLNTISAIAESDKVLGTFTINHFDNRLDKIYGDIKNVAKLRNKRKTDKELFLKRGLYQKDNSSKITEVKVRLEKIPKNSKNKVNDKALLTVNDYAEFLSKVYDNNSIDLEWLYNEGILEFLTFFAYYGDEWNIKPEADDFNTITNPVDRKAKIMDLFINNSALLAELSSYGKELFINSRIQINASIDYDDRQDNHIGFMHDLSYLFNEDRSVSLVGKNIFGKKKEDLFDEELRFVLLSMSKKMEIIDKLKDENVVSLNYEIRPANNGKLNKNDFNGETRKISSVLSMRNHNNSEFYQLVADKETGDRYGFKLKSFGERENDIVNIFEEMANNGIALDYIYNIILPQIREKTISEKLEKLYEYLLNKGHVEDISNLEENYQYKRVLAIYSFFNKDKVNIIKDFEHDFIINYLWKGDEAVGIINNLFLTRVNNPFQRETIHESDKDYFKSVKRYYSIENLTINELANSHTYIKDDKVKGIYNETTVKDATILKDLQKRIEVIDTFIETLKNKFITLFTIPDETFLFNEPVSNSKEIAEQMGAIFKRNTRNFPTFLAEHEIVGILAKEMSDYNSAFMGRIDVVYSNLEKERKIYLTVKKNNDIIIVKLYDGTLKSNEKSEFIVYNPIKTKIKTGDNKGKYSYTSSEKSTTTLDVNGVKDLLGFVSLTLASSNSKFRTMALHPDFNYDALSVNNYSDLIKLVTKSFLNGIEDTFFINPIISIENQIKDKTDIVVDNDDINKGNIPNDDTSTTLSLKSFVDEHILEGKTIENFKSYYSDISSYLGDLDSSIKNSNFKLSTIIDLINDSDLKSDYNKIINESNKETLEHIENVRDFVNDLVNFLNNDDTINTLMEKSCPF